MRSAFLLLLFKVVVCLHIVNGVSVAAFSSFGSVRAGLTLGVKAKGFTYATVVMAFTGFDQSSGRFNRPAVTTKPCRLYSL